MKFQKIMRAIKIQKFNNIKTKANKYNKKLKKIYIKKKK